VVPRSLSFNIPGLAVEVTSQKRIPTMFFGPWHVDQGGLAIVTVIINLTL